LEDALIKLGTVATDSFGVSGRAMLEALIQGERDPTTLAELARGRLRVKHAALVEALTGQFGDHHALVARMLLDQIDALGEQIQQLTTKIEQTITQLPAANPPSGGPGAAVQAGSGPARPVPGHAERVSESLAQDTRTWRRKGTTTRATPPGSSAKGQWPLPSRMTTCASGKTSRWRSASATGT
jgi:transposase